MSREKNKNILKTLVGYYAEAATGEGTRDGVLITFNNQLTDVDSFIITKMDHVDIIETLEGIKEGELIHDDATVANYILSQLTGDPFNMVIDELRPYQEDDSILKYLGNLAGDICACPECRPDLFKDSKAFSTIRDVLGSLFKAASDPSEAQEEKQRQVIKHKLKIAKIFESWANGTHNWYDTYMRLSFETMKQAEWIDLEKRAEVLNIFNEAHNEMKPETWLATYRIMTTHPDFVEESIKPHPLYEANELELKRLEKLFIESNGWDYDKTVVELAKADEFIQGLLKGFK